MNGLIESDIGKIQKNIWFRSLIGENKNHVALQDERGSTSLYAKNCDTRIAFAFYQ